MYILSFCLLMSFCYSVFVLLLLCLPLYLLSVFARYYFVIQKIIFIFVLWEIWPLRPAREAGVPQSRISPWLLYFYDISTQVAGRLRSIVGLISERETLRKRLCDLLQGLFTCIFAVGWESAYKYDNFKLRSRPTLYRAVSLRLFLYSWVKPI